jgi:glycosyltransferase involved in cell wall biosynthesis
VPNAPRPRVLFVIGAIRPGGAEDQLVEIIAGLHGRQIDASIATLGASPPNPLLPRLAAIGVYPSELAPRRLSPPLKALSAGVALARRIKAQRPDVVYAWLQESSVIAVPVCRALGTPIVVGRHNAIGPYVRSRLLPLLVSHAERHADLVTVVSAAVGQDAVRRGIPKRRVRLIHNGQVVEGPLDEPKAEQPVTLGYVALLRPEKGHRRLLDVLQRVDTDVAWRVDVAGSGPLAEELRAEVARHGLEERVQLLGWVEDVREFWRERHVAVLFSDDEGLGNALVEAALAGRPIVATAVGGVPEIVEPDGGLMAGVDRPDLLASALKRMIEEPELRRRAGAAAFRQAAERFDLGRSLVRQAEVIAEVTR